MTGNGNHTTYKFMVMTGGWCRWHYFTHITTDKMMIMTIVLMDFIIYKQACDWGTPPCSYGGYNKNSRRKTVATNKQSQYLQPTKWDNDSRCPTDATRWVPSHK